MRSHGLKKDDDALSTHNKDGRAIVLKIGDKEFTVFEILSGKTLKVTTKGSKDKKAADLSGVTYKTPPNPSPPSRLAFPSPSSRLSCHASLPACPTAIFHPHSSALRPFRENMCARFGCDPTHRLSSPCPSALSECSGACKYSKNFPNFWHIKAEARALPGGKIWLLILFIGMMACCVITYIIDETQDLCAPPAPVVTSRPSSDSIAFS